MQSSEVAGQGRRPVPTWLDRPVVRTAVPLCAILTLAGLLRLWNLSANVFGRSYYAAGVRSMMNDWHNFLFNAFDPAGFVSLDKPPVAIWLQVFGAKLVGFNGLAMLLPQVGEGLVAVFLVFLIVARAFGRAAGLVGALVLAITPVSVAVDRSNNTDSCLMVALLLAAWFAIRAAEGGRARPLFLSMLCLGIGFNVKMGAAWALAPALVLTYLWAGGTGDLRRRFGHATAAGIVLLAVSLSWVAMFDLTPTDRRPWAGGTTTNSMLDLAIHHNFLARISGRSEATDAEGTGVAAARAAEDPPVYDTSPPGPLRLLRPLQAGQAGWWLPLAIAGSVLGFRGMGAGPDDDPRKVASQRVAVAVWSGWLATYWLLFSFAGGIVHTYYLVALAPPLAALAGTGLSRLWPRWRAPGGAPVLLAGVLAATAAWQAGLFVAQTGPGTPVQLNRLFVVVMAVALMPPLAAGVRVALGGPAAVPGWRGALSVSALALVALPLACALSVVLERPNVAIPVPTLAVFDTARAAPARWSPGVIAHAREKLLVFLRSHHTTERFLVAMPTGLVAASLIVASGQPVMATGGYAGRDPILTPEALKRYVDTGQVRFVMIGGFTLAPEPAPHQQALEAWVRANGKPVERALWSLRYGRGDGTYLVPLGGKWVRRPVAELFDLKPRPSSSSGLRRDDAIAAASSPSSS